MRQSLVLLVVRRFEPNRKPPCWWRGRAMARGAEPGERGGKDLWSRDCRIELLDYHRSLVRKQMLVRGAACLWMQTWRRAVDTPPQLRASTYFLFAEREEPPTVVKGFNSKGGPLAGNEARPRGSHGDDKQQAREARKRTPSNLMTMNHRDVEADAAFWHHPEPL